jgi:hypothetical protein
MKRIIVKLECGHKKKISEFVIDAVDVGEVFCVTCKDFKKIKK